MFVQQHTAASNPTSLNPDNSNTLEKTQGIGTVKESVARSIGKTARTVTTLILMIGPTVSLKLPNIRLLSVSDWPTRRPKPSDMRQDLLFRALSDDLYVPEAPFIPTDHFFNKNSKNIESELKALGIDTMYLPPDDQSDDNYPAPSYQSVDIKDYNFPSLGETLKTEGLEPITTADDHTYLRANVVAVNKFEEYQQYSVGSVIESIIPSYVTDSFEKMIGYANTLQPKAVFDLIGIKIPISAEDEKALYPFMNMALASNNRAEQSQAAYMQTGKILPFENDLFPTVITYFALPKGSNLFFDKQDSTLGGQGRIPNHSLVVPQSQKFVVLENTREKNLVHFVLGALSEKNKSNPDQAPTTTK